MKSSGNGLMQQDQARRLEAGADRGPVAEARRGPPQQLDRGSLLEAGVQAADFIGTRDKVGGH
jgi:hypothetical protein